MHKHVKISYTVELHFQVVSSQVYFNRFQVDNGIITLLQNVVPLYRLFLHNYNSS